MTEHPVVRVEFDEARRLADLTATFRDMKFVRETLVRLLQLDSEDSRDDILIRSYWSAALIAYARSFSTGKRLALTKDVLKFRSGAEEVDDFMTKMRDKHIAHSVNPFEQTAVGLVLSLPDDAERKVEGVVALYSAHLIPNREGLTSCLAVVQILLDYLKAEAEKAETLVLEAARHHRVDQLYGLERLRIKAPGPDSAGRPRP